MPFAQGRLVGSATDFFNSAFLLGTRSQSLKLFFRVVMYRTMHAVAVTCKKRHTEALIGVTHFDDSGLVSAPKHCVVLLLPAVDAYLSSPVRPECDFSVEQFYSAAIRHLNALSNMFSKISGAKPPALRQKRL